MPEWLVFGAGVFVLIFFLELPDKTAMASLLLATRLPPLPVFVGAALAFVVQSAIAVLAGSLFGLLPRQPVRVSAGLLFLALAVLLVRRTRAQEAEEESQQIARETRRHHRPLITAFTVVFIAEWADLTQLATVALQARYRRPILIFFSATLALWAVTALAVTLGNRLGALIPERPLQYGAAAVMALIGILLVSGRLG